MAINWSGGKVSNALERSINIRPESIFNKFLFSSYTTASANQIVGFLSVISLELMDGSLWYFACAQTSRTGKIDIPILDGFAQTLSYIPNYIYLTVAMALL